MPDTGSIHVTIVDGRRQPLSRDTQVLVRLLSGAKKFDGWWSRGGDIKIKDIPFTDTGRDAYYVFVSAQGYADSVTPYPVALKRNGTAEALLLATPKNASFHFQKWEQFRQGDPAVVQLIRNGSTDPGTRYTDAYEGKPNNVGALLNLATAIKDIPLPDKTNPLSDYYWEVMWDQLAPDRFWAWVDSRVADRIK